MIGSLFFKAFVGFVVITGILSLALLIISSTAIKNLYIDTLMRETENLGNMLRSDIVAYLEEEKNLQLLVENISTNTNKRITVIRPDGTVKADSHAEPKRWICTGTGRRSSKRTAARSAGSSGTVSRWERRCSTSPFPSM